MPHPEPLKPNLKTASNVLDRKKENHPMQIITLGCLLANSSFLNKRKQVSMPK